MITLNTYLFALSAATTGALAAEYAHLPVFGRALSPLERRTLVWTASALLAASCVCAVVLRGVGVGIVEWFCAAGIGAIAAAVLLPYAPLWLPSLAAATAVGGALLTLSSLR